jgi:succinyl-CoA synthetase alpha subunit
VTPGKGGSDVDGIPVFDTVADAVKDTGAEVSVIYVPALLRRRDPRGRRLRRSPDRGDHRAHPVLDMAKVMDVMRSKPDIRLIGPNCPGIITPATARKAARSASCPATSTSPARSASSRAPAR